jgi:phosphatidylglycerol:prolipoprotein diacylglycerol transferase
MIPELFRIGNFAISPFGVMMVLAFVAGYVQLSWAMRHGGFGSEDDASALVFAAGVGGIVGAKVYYAVLHQDWRLLFDRAGLVWYGGFILAALLVMWVLHRRRLPFVRTADAVMVGVALGYGIGRIGCFLVGDDYGVPTDLPWGVTFPYGLPATTAANLRLEYGSHIPPDVPPDALVPVHPTQLYETALALGIWAVGLWMLRRRVRPGGAALGVGALLAAERFGIEFLRAKDDRFLHGFTLAQVISVLLLVVVLALWLRWRRGGAGRDAAEGARPRTV